MRAPVTADIKLTADAFEVLHGWIENKLDVSVAYEHLIITNQVGSYPLTVWIVQISWGEGDGFKDVV